MIYTMTVDFQLLHKQCSVGDFFVALEVAPHEALSCLGAAAYEVIYPIYSSNEISSIARLYGGNTFRSV